MDIIVLAMGAVGTKEGELSGGRMVSEAVLVIAGPLDLSVLPYKEEQLPQGEHNHWVSGVCLQSLAMGGGTQLVDEKGPALLTLAPPQACGHHRTG